MLGMAEPMVRPMNGLMGRMTPQVITPPTSGITSGADGTFYNGQMVGQNNLPPGWSYSNGNVYGPQRSPNAPMPQLGGVPNLGGGGLMGSIGARPPQPSPLLNTASNYNYPITSGLMGGISSGIGSATPTTPPPAGGTDWTQVALGLAGNPKAGPLAPVAAPGPAQGAPGAPGGGGGGGHGLGSGIGGLLTALAQNPSLAKGLVNSGSSLVKNIGSLFGGGDPTGLASDVLSSSDVAAGVDGGLSNSAVDAALQSYADQGIASMAPITDGAAAGAADAGAAGAGAAGAGIAGDVGTGAMAGEAGSLGGDAAASAAAGSGGSGAGLAGLAAAWPAAIAVGGFLGMNALENHNSIVTNAQMMGDFGRGIPRLTQAASSPAAALAANHGYLPPGMTAADLASADASEANMLQTYYNAYKNGSINAEYGTNNSGLVMGSAGNVNLLGQRGLLRPT